LLAIVTFVPVTANPTGTIPVAVPWKWLFLTALLSPWTKTMCHWLCDDAARFLARASPAQNFLDAFSHL
jgi:hypothetical protein